MSGAVHVLGNVGFGPAQTLWEEQPTLRELYDQACAGLVRAECEIEELRAEVALAEAERIELAKQLRSEREALAESVREFAGVIEGGQRHCDSEAYATPSDLSPRTTLAETVKEFREGLFFGEGKK
jgi:hypothetical protein